jgi:excisionase family DNA binding protein
VVPVSSVEIRPLSDVYAAAELLHRSRNSIYILAREGKIPHYRVGNSIRFDLGELRAWLEENRRGPKVAPK